MTDQRPDPDALLRELKLKEETRTGKLKIFFGYAAGVGKTYAMLEAAHHAKEMGVDVVAGYIEPHVRPETLALLDGLEQLPNKEIPYKNITLREFDLDGALARKPQLILVDELAHTNAEGCRHRKRYQDIEELLKAGVDVYTTVNVQHIESLNEEVQEIARIEVRERVPDNVLALADEVVNIDLTAEELITRLKAGKIYKPEKVQTALDNFFRQENILQLRELALKEVALRVEKKVENEVTESPGLRHEKFLAVIDSSEKSPRRVIRKTARLATRFNAHFAVLYVQTDRESSDRIPLANQRYLINNFKGKALAANTGSSQEVRANSISDNVTSTNTVSDAILQLTSGKVDAIVVDNITAERYSVNSDNLYSFELSDDEVEQVDKAVAMQKGNDDLKAIVNTVVADVTESGQVDEWVTEYAKMAADMGLNS